MSTFMMEYLSWGKFSQCGGVRGLVIICCLLSTSTLSTDGGVVFTSHLKMETLSVYRPHLSYRLLFCLCTASHISVNWAAAGLHVPQSNQRLSFHSLSTFFSCLFHFYLVSASKHSEAHKERKCSIPQLAVKLNQKENYFDRWCIKGDMIQTEPTF